MFSLPRVKKFFPHICISFYVIPQRDRRTDRHKFCINICTPICWRAIKTIKPDAINDIKPDIWCKWRSWCTLQVPNWFLVQKVKGQGHTAGMRDSVCSSYYLQRRRLLLTLTRWRDHAWFLLDFAATHSLTYLLTCWILLWMDVDIIKSLT